MCNKEVLHSCKIYRSTNLINTPLYPRSSDDNVLSIFFKLAKKLTQLKFTLLFRRVLPQYLDFYPEGEL